MSIIIYTLSCGLTSFGLYRIFEKLFGIPSYSITSAINNINGKQNMTERLHNALLPFARLISKLLPMSEYKDRQLKTDFSRLNIRQTPKEYVSGTIAKSALLALIGLFFIPMGMPILSLLTTVISMLMYFNSMQSVRKKAEALNREIDAELPRMVETLNYSLMDNRDLISFFEKYRKVSGKALGSELDRLIIDMKTGNQEEALRCMDARLGLPSFAALSAILCGVYHGVDQQTSLLVLEQDMRTKEREILRVNMEKRPKRIKAASFILTVLMILMFMVPLILLIINNLQIAGF